MGDVYVDDELIFKAQASVDDNITGNPSTERMVTVDWFDGVTLDTTNDYVQTLGGANDLGALVAGGENGFKGTCGDGDNEISFLSTALIFDFTQKPAIESKVEITNVTGTFVFFGFSDATSETTPEATIDAPGGTLAKGSSTADAVGFVIDADLGTSSIYCASVKTSGAIQSVDTGIDWADTEKKRLRVALDALGNARFYVDGIQKGYIALAVADVPLCATWNYGQRNGEANQVVEWRYLKKWQNCP